MHSGYFVLLLAFGIATSIPLASASHGNCYEDGDCPITEPLTWLSGPFQVHIGDYIFLIAWGGAIGLLYIKTENAMFTAVLGVMALAGFSLYSPTVITNSNTGNLILWGIAIAAVAFGCTMYYLLRVRVSTPV